MLPGETSSARSAPTLRYAAVAALIVVAALSRLLPHPPNFAPIGAIALFGGAMFRDVRLAVAVPLAAMLLSDAALGFHPMAPLVYLAFGLTVLVGVWVGRRRSALRVAAGALCGSVLFFLVTNFNFAYPESHVLYPRTWAGLLTAYAAAVPFFRNTVAGDLFYALILFGGFAVLERLLPAVAEQRTRRATATR
jgi:hypothetical protein